MTRIINVPVITYVDIEVDEKEFEQAVKHLCLNSCVSWKLYNNPDLGSMLENYEAEVGRSPFEDMFT